MIIHADNSITVEDNGRGIPVDMHPMEKLPGVELAMTVLHAGGKFDKNTYKVSGGLHGVGVSVVNALSEQLKVWVKRDGKEHYMDFARGNTTTKLKVLGDVRAEGHAAPRSGSSPTPQIFTETQRYDYATLASRLRELSFLNKGISITLTDEREGEAARRRRSTRKGGLRSSCRSSTRSSKPLHPEVLYHRRPRRTTSASSSRCSTTTATTRTSSRS